MQHFVRRRVFGIAAAVTAVALTTTACASGSGSGGSDGDSFTVGVSMLNLRDPDLAAMSAAMKKQAKSSGINLVTVDAKGDVATELNQVEDLTTRKVDAIIMMPIDGKTSQSAAKLANSADIPLFILSTAFEKGSSVKEASYIGVDDTEAGRIQAEYVNKMLPDGGKLIYIVGTYGASWTDRRKAGFEEKKDANLKVATEIQANGSRDEAKRVMEDLLRRYSKKGEISGLVTHNDEMALGAASAIKEAGRMDEFKVIVGVDGTPTGMKAISDGLMTATVKQNSAEQGIKAVDVVKSFLDGKKVDAAYNLPFTLVTKDNVAEYLK
ncbi:LacI family transcriptional regulator [Aeromicrobium sp. Root236]|uniref:sugar ABC transporter substrate-binding protein n=1 Tax=Aeromicrobium sp. Root236 TaxID=1736498 RepID=UPI0006F80AF7|nr:sugar ABC transporter substrate-binding protein [Aeromicrobium sp. Root236]KRC65819.1 LacI family transcriptional regulator [Aeromicrobium sp. Root236]